MKFNQQYRRMVEIFNALEGCMVISEQTPLVQPNTQTSYDSLKKDKSPLNIAKYIKDSKGMFNDDEAIAEFAFNMIPNMSIYREVAKILGPDPYKFIKGFMDTSKKWYGKDKIVSVDEHYKKLKSAEPKLAVSSQPKYDKKENEKWTDVMRKEFNPLTGKPIETDPEKWSPEAKEIMKWQAEIPSKTGKELEDAVSTLSFVFSVLGGISAPAAITSVVGKAIQLTCFEIGLVASVAEIYFAKNNGNDYETGFLMAMTILNFDDIGSILGKSNFSEQFLREAFEFVKRGGKWAKNAKYTVLAAEFIKNSERIAQLANTKFAKKFSSNFSYLLYSKPISYIIGLVGKLIKASGKTLIITFPVTGGYVTFDQLYQALYGSEREKMVMRELSSVRQLIGMIVDRKIPADIQKEMTSIINGKLSAEGSKYIYENTLKALKEAGGLENLENSLIYVPSKFQTEGKFDENIKKLGDQFYKGVEGSGTELTEYLIPAIRKIKNAQIFDEVNIYLYYKYKENIWDLLNGEWFLNKGEKEIIIWNFAINELKGYYNPNGKERIWLDPVLVTFKKYAPSNPTLVKR